MHIRMVSDEEPSGESGRFHSEHGWSPTNLLGGMIMLFGGSIERLVVLYYFLAINQTRL